MVRDPLGAYRRFADLLALTGIVAFATTFAESPDPWLYTAGRTAGWVLEVLLVVVILAYPSGRLDDMDRKLAGAMAVVVALCYFPTLALSEHFKVPSPYTSCTEDCPSNAVLPFGAGAASVGDALLAVGSFLLFAVLVAVLVRLQHGASTAGRLERSMLMPVLVVGMARVTLVGSSLIGRDAFGAGDLANVSAPLIAWLTPGIGLAFLLGVMRSRLYGERALRELATCLSEGPDVAKLERAFSSAFDGSGVTVVFPHGSEDGRWIDWKGRNVPLSGLGARQHLPPRPRPELWDRGGRDRVRSVAFGPAGPPQRRHRLGVRRPREPRLSGGERGRDAGGARVPSAHRRGRRP